MKLLCIEINTERDSGCITEDTVFLPEEYYIFVLLTTLHLYLSPNSSGLLIITH